MARVPDLAAWQPTRGPSPFALRPVRQPWWRNSWWHVQRSAGQPSIRTLSFFWHTNELRCYPGLSSSLNQTHFHLLSVFVTTMSKPGNSLRSPVWKHFGLPSNGRADCNLCGKNIATSGNTSNAWDHLHDEHEDKWRELKHLPTDQPKLDDTRWRRAVRSPALQEQRSLFM